MNDLISRQAAIDAADRADYTGLSVEDVKKVTDEVVKELKRLPSAQPEPKTAHWIPLDERFASWSSYYKCSECGFRINLRTVMDFSGQSVDYCPHCGARMEVKHEA